MKIRKNPSTKNKSLKSYALQFRPTRLLRTNLLNFKKDGKICNLPLYAISQLARLMAADLENGDSR
jgi:hypothetical protein